MHAVVINHVAKISDHGDKQCTSDLGGNKEACGDRAEESEVRIHHHICQKQEKQVGEKVAR